MRSRRQKRTLLQRFFDEMRRRLAENAKQSFKRWSKTAITFLAALAIELKKLCVALIQLTLVMLLVGVALRELQHHRVRIYQWLVELIGAYKAQDSIAVVVVATGFGAAWFKRKSQKWYGFVEIGFGIISGFSIALNMTIITAALPQWASLVGCAYVIARGLNNVSDAEKVALTAV